MGDIQYKSVNINDIPHAKSLETLSTYSKVRKMLDEFIASENDAIEITSNEEGKPFSGKREVNSFVLKIRNCIGANKLYRDTLKAKQRGETIYVIKIN